MCRAGEEESVSSHPFRIPRSSMRETNVPPGQLTSMPTQKVSKGLRMSPAKGFPDSCPAAGETVKA